MKLITLNAWGGRLHQPLLQSIKRLAGSVDVFCFQEVFSTETEAELSNGAKMNLYQELKNILTEYQAFYSMKSRGYDYSGYIGKQVEFGNAIFVRKNIPVLASEELFEAVTHPNHDWKQTAVAQAQLLLLEISGVPVGLCNFHGLWVKDTNKRDIPERIEQSKQVRAALDQLAPVGILCGDFNLLPDGESLKILGQGLRNLIAEFGIASTRSEHYTKPMKFADYILTSPGITVHGLKTLPDQISDHLALELDFEINPAQQAVAATELENYGQGN